MQELPSCMHSRSSEKYALTCTFALFILMFEFAVYFIEEVPYSWKYWRSLYLAEEPKIKRKIILASHIWYRYPVPHLPTIHFVAISFSKEWFACGLTYSCFTECGIWFPGQQNHTTMGRATSQQGVSIVSMVPHKTKGEV